MISDLKTWTLLEQTTEDTKYMQPLFMFVSSVFVEIFGETVMNKEPCILYNDISADFPMLIRNTTPIRIRTNAKSLNYWAQFIFNLSHEMTHYVIRQYKPDKAAIVKWFEETLCEAMSLYILRLCSSRWNECILFPLNAGYGKSLEDYLLNEYLNTEDSVLKKCHTVHGLELVESSCEVNRKERSIERNYLYDTFCEMPNNIAEFVYYPLYVRDNIQIDFNAWEHNQECSQLVLRLKDIHPVLTA